MPIMGSIISDPDILDGLNEGKSGSFDAVELHEAIYAELRKIAAAKMRNERAAQTSPEAWRRC